MVWGVMGGVGRAIWGGRGGCDFVGGVVGMVDNFRILVR